jgi:geranylgeranyl pyrophosphate synthase
MSELGEFWAKTVKLVDEKLDELIPSDHVEPKRLHSAIRWSVFAGGKRLRPALLIATGKMFGADEQKMLNTAAAVEMIHTYSLIHDDLPAMDNDSLRRGRATCHVKFDEATAILAGDCLQVLAFSAIAKDENLRDEIKVAVIAELAEAATKMARGQQLDLEAEKKRISFAELEEIHKNKTGAMICFSVRAGAMIAEVKSDVLEKLTRYASLLGLLFQITDDLLDVTQSTETLGKTAGKDLIAEKATYPSFYGIEKTRRLAEEAYLNTIKILEDIDADTSLLQAFANFILHRNK